VLALASAMLVISRDTLLTSVLIRRLLQEHDHSHPRLIGLEQQAESLP